MTDKTPSCNYNSKKRDFCISWHLKLISCYCLHAYRTSASKSIVHECHSHLSICGQNVYHHS